MMPGVTTDTLTGLATDMSPVRVRAALRLEGVVRVGAVLLIAATRWRSARSSEETLEHLTRS